MSGYDDELGDALKRIEMDFNGTEAELGEPVVVRVDGKAFSTFTSSFERPFDRRIAQAMDTATHAIVDLYGGNCRLGFTQSDEATFVFYDPVNPLPFNGRLTKLATECASLMTGEFIKAAFQLFPVKIVKATPRFDGRATPYSLEMAALCVRWREEDARKNAVSMAAQHHFKSQSLLQGKSSAQMKEMMYEDGFDYRSYPERFLRGAFFRRVEINRPMTEAELERIPPQHRHLHSNAVKRTTVARLTGVPPLNIVENLEDFVFHRAEPIAADRPFASSITP